MLPNMFVPSLMFPAAHVSVAFLSFRLPAPAISMFPLAQLELDTWVSWIAREPLIVRKWLLNDLPVLILLAWALVAALMVGSLVNAIRPMYTSVLPSGTAPVSQLVAVAQSLEVVPFQFATAGHQRSSRASSRG
jgi:hypothetical protein